MTFEELAGAVQRLRDLEQVLVCPVGEREKIETLLLRYDVLGLWTVSESPHCPADTLYLITPPPAFRI